MTGNNKITLRPTVISDLELLYTFQLDDEARHLAAFTPQNYSDKTAYIDKHTKLISDQTVNGQTITIDGTIVGSIAKFEMEGNSEITYWIERNYWRIGVATSALEQFLKLERSRPIFGRVAFDNIGSQRVLEKCGFIKTGTDRGFANARQAEITEFIYKLT